MLGDWGQVENGDFSRIPFTALWCHRCDAAAARDYIVALTVFLCHVTVCQLVLSCAFAAPDCCGWGCVRRCRLELAHVTILLECRLRCRAGPA